MLSLGATIGIYTGLGFLGGLAINRPVFGVGYGISNGVMTVALGILFGPTGYYVSIGIQALVLTAKIRQFAQINREYVRL